METKINSGNSEQWISYLAIKFINVRKIKIAAYVIVTAGAIPHIIVRLEFMGIIAAVFPYYLPFAVIRKQGFSVCAGENIRPFLFSYPVAAVNKRRDDNFIIRSIIGCGFNKFVEFIIFHFIIFNIAV